jgi:hypothetical protein
MTSLPLRTLLALRYRLLWAHVRTRNGRVVLFLLAYLVAAFVALLLALGGLGAAAASIRLGRGELVARVVLSGIWLNAMLAAVFLGVGVNPAFSDAALRRYPISARARLAARHVTAFLEPLWIFVLALAHGLAAGFWAFGTASPWLALPAAGLFVATTYLLARVVLRLGEWVLAKRGGLLLALLAGVALMTLVPLVPLLARTAARRGGALPGLSLLGVTPPFAAASAMAGVAPWSAGSGLLMLAGWAAVLCALLIAVERLPLGSRTVAHTAATWDHPCDRMAKLFGPRTAPLAGKMLRYYLRSPQVRYNYPLVLPMLALLLFTRGADDAPMSAFLFALGAATAVGFLATGALSMNLFGFDGHGFRRYFLLPVSPAQVLRTAALISLIPGAVLIPIGFVAWFALAPVPTNWRMATMLLSAGFGGLLFFHALGLWATLLAPRPIPFDTMFGNKLSLAANLLLVGTIATFFGLSAALTAVGADAALRAWWVAPLCLVGAAAFHALTVRAGARVLVTHRERMLAIIEGQA